MIGTSRWWSTIHTRVADRYVAACGAPRRGATAQRSRVADQGRYEHDRAEDLDSEWYSDSNSSVGWPHIHETVTSLSPSCEDLSK